MMLTVIPAGLRHGKASSINLGNRCHRPRAIPACPCLSAAKSRTPPKMASETPAAAVPGLREQAVNAGNFVAQYVTQTVKDPAARDALLAEVRKHVEEIAALTKEHVTDAEKRAKLLEYAKSFANQAVTAAKDPNTRATLLDKLKATVAVAQEAIKDPAKRQEIHDTLAATTHKLLAAAQGAPAAAAPAAAAETAAPVATS